jgi:hypothetical protein
LIASVHVALVLSAEKIGGLSQDVNKSSTEFYGSTVGIGEQEGGGD